MPITRIFLAALSLLLLATGCAPRTARLAFLGDVMLGRGVAEAYAPSGNWAEALADLTPDLQAADLALANLESPLSRSAPTLEDVNSYNLCAPAAGVTALQSAGLDLLAVVNNHSGDCAPGCAGAGCSAETAEILSAAGMQALGEGGLHRTVNGLKLAFLAFEDVSTPLDLSAAARRVADERASGRLVIVSMHWGMEYQSGADAVQRAQAQALADAGAALIWGHHPHVLQPVEWLQGINAPRGMNAPRGTVALQGEGQPRPTLAAYSLGNALFDQAFMPAVQRSALLWVTLDAGGVVDYGLVPFEIKEGRAEK